MVVLLISVLEFAVLDSMIEVLGVLPRKALRTLIQSYRTLII